MLYLKFDNIEEMQNFFFKDDKDFELIYNNTFKCIEEAVEAGEDSATLVVVAFENKRDEVVMKSKSKDFEEALKTCLNYFEHTEDYDKCKKISTLIEKLKQR